MSCSGVRLGEYLDGELAAGDRPAVESHLGGCPACRAELEDLRKLEGILRSVPAGSIPDAERFLQRVRGRSRAGGRAWMSLAAAVLAGVTALLVWPAPKGVNLRAELESYARHGSDGAERTIRDAGALGLQELQAGLQDPDSRIQFAAATLLFKYADPATRELVLGKYAEPRKAEWTLADAGGDATDIEMLPVAVSALEVQGQERWAIDVLRKLNWLSLEAKRKVAGSVVTLLKHENPRIQGLALEIARELDLDFPLAALVDLLDSPELGGQALKVLRDGTGQDFGKDKAAWLRAVQKKEAP